MTISKDVFHEPACHVCKVDYNYKKGADCIVFVCNHIYCIKCAVEILNQAKENRVNCRICNEVTVLTYSDELPKKRFWKIASVVAIFSAISLYKLTFLNYNRIIINAENEEEDFDNGNVSGTGSVYIIGSGLLMGTYCLAIKYLQDAREEVEFRKLGSKSYNYSEKTIQRIQYFPPLKSDIIDV